jgi:hypothetical protein
MATHQDCSGTGVKTRGFPVAAQCRNHYETAEGVPEKIDWDALGCQSQNSAYMVRPAVCAGMGAAKPSL